jgi:hypothetical protein
MDWRKSTYSGSNGGNCLETASDSAMVKVRDSTDRGGVMLAFSAGAWEAFLGALR